MALGFEELNIKITSESQSAADGISNLIAQLERLNSVSLDKFYSNFRQVVSIPTQFEEEADKMAKNVAKSFRLTGDAYDSFVRDLSASIKAAQTGGRDYDAMERASKVLHKEGSVIEDTTESWERLRQYISTTTGTISDAARTADELTSKVSKITSVLGGGWSFSDNGRGEKISLDEYIPDMDKRIGTTFWEDSKHSEADALEMIVATLEAGRETVREFSDDASGYMKNRFISAAQVVEDAVEQMSDRLAENPSLGKSRSYTVNTFADSMSSIAAATKSFSPEAINGITDAFQRLNKVAAGADFATLSAKIAPFITAMNSVQFNTANLNGFSALGTALTNMSKARIPVGLFSALQSFIEKTNGLEPNIAVIQTLRYLAETLTMFASKTGKRYEESFTSLANGLERLFQVLARAPSISENSVRALEAISKLDAESVKASRGFVRMSESANKGAESVRNFADHTHRSAVSTQSLTSRLAFTIGKFRQIYFVIRRIGRLFSKMVTSAMDYVETLNYFNAAFDQVASRSEDIFGQAGQEAGSAFTNRFAEEAAKLTEKMSGYAVSASGMVTNTMGTTLGMNPASMMNYQATFAQMASSMGVSSEMATDLSRALTEIGADLASVKNLGFEDTWKNLQSGLVGMSRAVDKYGLNIRNVNLQQKLTQLGIEANIQEMNQQDKALLRTIIILENSQYAWGDLADTLQQPANQIRMLKSGIANLGRTIGNLFLPIVAAALPYINAFVVALQKMFETLVNLMGIDFDWGSVGGAAINSEWADYLDDTTDSLGEATKAAEEWKNQILGFDEINKLGSESSDSGSGSASGSNPYVSLQLENALRLALERYQKVWDESYASVNNRVNDIALKIIEWFGNIKKAVEPTTTALKSLWNEVFVPLGQWKWEVLKDFYNDFLKPVGQWVIGEGIPKLVELFIKFYNDINWDTFRSMLDNFWKALEPFAVGTFNGIIRFFEALEPIAAITFDGLIALLDMLNRVLASIDPENLEKLGELFAVFLALKFGGGIFSNVLGGLGKAGSGLLSMFGLGGLGKIGGKGLFSKIFGLGGKVLFATLFADIVGEGAENAWTGGGKKQNHGASLWGEWLTNIGINAASYAAVGAKGGPWAAIIAGIVGVGKALATFEDSTGEGFDDKLKHGADFALDLMELIFAGINGKTIEEHDKEVAAAEEKVERNQAQRARERAARRIFRNKELTANIWNQLAYDTDREVDIFGNRENQAINRHEAEVDTLRQKNMSMRRQQLVGAWEDLSGGVVSVIQTRFPWITGELQRKMIEQKTVVAKSADDTKKAYVNAFNGIGDGVTNALSGIDKAIAKSQIARDGEARKAGAAAKKAFTDTFNPIGTEVTNVLNGINSKIGSTLSYATVRAGLGGVVSAFNNAFGDAANAALTQYNSMASSMNTATVNKNKAVNFSKVPLLKYANGGFPPENGFFFANSAELVGRFSNGRTAVANNEQIIQGIEGGVARGMAQAIMSTANATGGTNGQPVQVVITVDSETLYRATLRGESKYNNRYHMTVR